MKEFYPLKPSQQLLNREQVSLVEFLMAMLGQIIGGLTSLWLLYSIVSGVRQLVDSPSLVGVLTVFAMFSLGIFMIFHFIIYPYFSPQVNKVVIENNILTFYQRPWFAKWKKIVDIDMDSVSEIRPFKTSKTIKINPTYKAPISITAKDRKYVLEFKYTDGSKQQLVLVDTWGWGLSTIDSILKYLSEKYPKIKVLDWKI